mmetsp:Transcript_4100/g.9824  ORF Transcript_4100/g.9824 Transcript_4100/m.9824 type:complete len:310 (+) Transcript_4100:966-1895(+)
MNNGLSYSLEVPGFDRLRGVIDVEIVRFLHVPVGLVCGSLGHFLWALCALLGRPARVPSAPSVRHLSVGLQLQQVLHREVGCGCCVPNRTLEGQTSLQPLLILHHGQLLVVQLFLFEHHHFVTQIELLGALLQVSELPVVPVLGFLLELRGVLLLRRSLRFLFFHLLLNPSHFLLQLLDLDGVSLFHREGRVLGLCHGILELGDGIHVLDPLLFRLELKLLEVVRRVHITEHVCQQPSDHLGVLLSKSFQHQGPIFALDPCLPSDFAEDHIQLYKLLPDPLDIHARLPNIGMLHHTCSAWNLELPFQRI